MVPTPSIQYARALVVSLLVAVIAFMSAAVVTATTQPGQATAVAPEAALGLVAPGRYESPQFGHVVEWDARWEADLGATESVPAIALDHLSIVADEVRFQVFHIAADGETAADYAERFVAFRMSGDPTMTVTASGERRGVTWAAYTFELEGTETAGVVEISLVGTGSTIQVVEVMAGSDEFDQAFATAMDSIRVDGGEPYRILRGWPA